MSTTPRPMTPAEQRYRQKTDASDKLLIAHLQALKAKRPDIYREQVERLDGSYSNDIEPSELQEPDRLLVAARALE